MPTHQNNFQTLFISISLLPKLPEFPCHLLKIKSDLCYELYYRECNRLFTVTNEEHAGISALTTKRIQPKDYALGHF